jgi:hypothetical protein
MVVALFALFVALGGSASALVITGRVGARGFSAVDSESLKAAIANCPAGTGVLGTGFGCQGVGAGTFDELAVRVARPIDDTRVIVSAHEVVPLSSHWAVIAEAICARVAP